MEPKNLHHVLLFITVVMIASCGTGKKLEKSQADLAAAQEQIQELSTSNEALKQQLTAAAEREKRVAAETQKLVQDCEASKQELMVMQEALQEQYETLQAVMEKVEAALADFDEKGVDVYYKNGLVYVTMEDKLLYKSGSAKLGEAGKEALSNLANVLNAYPNLRVIVLGNTDNAKFKGDKDNWTLSTERANGVVRVLRDTYKVDPVRLTSAGKAEYNPLADNSTTEGKAKNRRTEIILNPDMDKIWESARRERE